MTPLRKLFSPTHPALQGARILGDDDLIFATDETACASTLLTTEGEEWRKVDPDVVGLTVDRACSEGVGDMDRDERLYVRPRQSEAPALAAPIDPFDGWDFGPLYYDFPKCLAILRAFPQSDPTGGRRVGVHMYWKNLRPFGRKQILPIKSFLATQAPSLRLTLWSDRDITDNETLRPWLKHIDFKVYDPFKEGEGTGVRPELLGVDDEFVWPGGDLFRAVVLHNHGGLYVDMDSVFLRDLRPVLGREFMYKWGTHEEFISSAVMLLEKGGALAKRLLDGINELTPGYWACRNNMRAFAIEPFRVFPSAFFNPEWQLRDEGEPFEVHPTCMEPFPGTFVWHWHNRWDAPVARGCKFELLEAMTQQRLWERGYP